MGRFYLQISEVNSGAPSFAPFMSNIRRGQPAQNRGMLSEIAFLMGIEAIV